LRKTAATVAIVFLLGLALFAAGDWEWNLSLLESWIEAHLVLGAALYIGIFIASTLLPITSLPLLPLAARCYGVPTTILLSSTGWWIGCLAAFQISRWGRPYLDRIASMRAIARCEQMIAGRRSFGTIVLLSVLFPGDIVGFTLGLLREVPFRTYAGASLIGTVPCAVVASYAGDEVGRGQFLSATLVIGAVVAGVIIARRVWQARCGVSKF